MRDELAVETIEKSFLIGQNHTIIQQRQIFEVLVSTEQSLDLIVNSFDIV